MFSKKVKNKVRDREIKELELIQGLIKSISEANKVLIETILPRPDQLDTAALHHTSDAQTSSSGTGEI